MTLVILSYLGSDRCSGASNFHMQGLSDRRSGTSNFAGFTARSPIWR